MNSMNGTINSLQERIGRLVNQNTGMEGEMRGAQENMRLSANQISKLTNELNEYRNRVQVGN